MSQNRYRTLFRRPFLLTPGSICPLFVALVSFSQTSSSLCVLHTDRRYNHREWKAQTAKVHSKSVQYFNILCNMKIVDIMHAIAIFWSKHFIPSANMKLINIKIIVFCGWVLLLYCFLKFYLLIYICVVLCLVILCVCFVLL